MERISNALACHRFMSGLEAKHIEKLMKHATQATFEAGTYVFHESEPANSFYLIRSGRIHIELSAEHGTVLVQSVGPGDFIGWSWLLPPHKWRFDAHVVERSELIVLNGQELRDELEEDHELGYRLMLKFIEVIAQRLEGSRIQLMDLYGSPR